MAYFSFVDLAAAVVIFFLILTAITSRNQKNSRWSTNSCPPSFEWYERNGGQIAIRPYPSGDLAASDANRCAEFGWSVQSVVSSLGPIYIGRTASGVARSGRSSLLNGGTRDQGGVTVTFVRRPIALAA